MQFNLGLNYLSHFWGSLHNHSTNTKNEGVFWLSDSRDVRESDATLIVSPGRLARFDIGFIGIGNPEISKDKLSRWAREMETAGGTVSSTTFIIVDRLPKTGKTEKAAEEIGAELIQMSMQYWVKDLARRLGDRFGIEHELQTISEDDIGEYLHGRLASIPVQEFLSGVSTQVLAEEAEEQAETDADGT